MGISVASNTNENTRAFVECSTPCRRPLRIEAALTQNLTHFCDTEE
jgi:hypothetical protein